MWCIFQDLDPEPCVWHQRLRQEGLRQEGLQHLKALSLWHRCPTRGSTGPSISRISVEAVGAGGSVSGTSRPSVESVSIESVGDGGSSSMSRSSIDSVHSEPPSKAHRTPHVRMDPPTPDMSASSPLRTSSECAAAVPTVDLVSAPGPLRALSAGAIE